MCVYNFIHKTQSYAQRFNINEKKDHESGLFYIKINIIYQKRTPAERII